MIITADTETQGLNSQRFILGCISTEEGQQRTFYDKKSMWDYILQLGREQKKRKRNLTVYMHNLQYDLYGICDWTTPGISIICTNPFLMDLDNIKFIDSTALYRGSLATLGTLIGNEKAPTPEWLKQDTYAPTTEELWEAARYCMQDCNVLLHGILKLRERLRSIGITTRTLITIGQIAITSYIHYLQGLPNAQDYFKQGYDESGVSYLIRGVLPPPINAEQTRQGYKGARVQAFHTGHYTGVHHADINSMYPYIMSTMRYPDLRTETTTDVPTHHDFIRHHLPRIGISMLDVTITSDTPLGILPIRGEEDTYYPTGAGKRLIGTWTHDEITYALQHHFISINHVFWTQTWDTMTTNPLSDYITMLYQQRRNATNEYDTWFYKQLMNHLYGKFAQHRDNTLIENGPIEELDERLAQGWDVLFGSGMTNLYRKTIPGEQKKFYAPIISALITAGARIHLHKHLAAISYDNLLYCDTDSIIWVGTGEEFKYTNDLGGLKCVAHDTSAYIAGKKTYTVGDTAKASGIGYTHITPSDLIAGTIVHKRMTGILTAPGAEHLGTFTTKTTIIEEHPTDYDDTQTLYIDHNLVTPTLLQYLGGTL